MVSEMDSAFPQSLVDRYLMKILGYQVEQMLPISLEVQNLPHIRYLKYQF